MLLRKAVLFILALSLLFNCGKKKSDIVGWSPAQPKAGEPVTITFRSEKSEYFRASSDSVFIIYQLQNAKNSEVQRISMQGRNGIWQAEIMTEPEHLLLNFKFENNQGLVEDNAKKRWTIFLRDENSAIRKDSHYLVGEYLYQIDPSQYPFSRMKAIDEFEKELELYPDNYKTWFDLWYSRISTSNEKSAALDRVRQQFDSLKSVSQPGPEFYHLAFRTNSILLRNGSEAEKYAKMIIRDYKDYSEAESIELSLIYLNHGNDTARLVTELKKFANRATDEKMLRNLNYQLGSLFRQQRDVENSMKHFQKVIDIDKDDIAVRLTIARIYLEQKEYDAAWKMVDEAEANCTVETFIQSNPWESPAQRESWLNLNRCQVYSTRAAMYFEQEEFAKSIESRKYVLNLGTPFPAFEWTKIGDTYVEMNELDNAQVAYLKAVSINETQEEARNSLKNIFRQRNGTTADFNRWLDEEVAKTIKAAAKQAPDFELQDIDNNIARLNEQRGKIVVVTFWDSWSREFQQELPHLNSLVEIYKDQQRVVFWAVSAEAPVSVTKFIGKNPFKFRVFHSGYDVKKMYDIIGVPTHVVIDRQGKIRFTHIGYSGNLKEKLQREIQSLLDEPKNL